MPQIYRVSALIIVVALGMSVVCKTGRSGQPDKADSAALAPPLYAFCVEEGVPGVKPRPIAEQAKLFRELGFDGAAYPLWLDGQLSGNLHILDQAGLQLSMVFIRVNLKSAAQPYDPRVADAMSELKGRGTTVCVLLGGFKPGDPQGMEPAVKVLRKLGDLAAQYQLRISIYHHLSNWTESLPFALEVAKNTAHANVGVNFNLCHWLKVEGDKDYRPLLRENVAKIFAVTINGAKLGTDTWTDGLILPLDQGDFDNRSLLATLREAGYRGPIGLMCFGVPGDPSDYLAIDEDLAAAQPIPAGGQIVFGFFSAYESGPVLQYATAAD